MMHVRSRGNMTP